MPRGGLRPNTKVESNHLFKPKWNNKKTTAIRIPEIFKDSFIAIARYLDKLESYDKDKDNILEKLINYNTLECNLKDYQNKVIELQEKNQQLSNNIENQINQNSQKNKYKIAVECFEEFVETKKLNMEELYKSRRNTKKHQLHEINQWLTEKSKSSK